MPRRLPVRPAKVFGNFFVLIVLCLMGFIYYTYIFVVWGPRAESKLYFEHLIQATLSGCQIFSLLILIKIYAIND